MNNGNSPSSPVFTEQLYFDMEKVNHGMHAGGGDWNGDLIRDFLHMPFGGGEYKLFPGETVGANGLKFKEGGLSQCTVLSIGSDSNNKARKCAWAWDFSGTAAQRGATEYVGITETDEEIAFYEWDGSQSQKIAVLVDPDGSTPLLTVGDLNEDGKMDILFSCGLWNNEQDKTKIYAMYGKGGGGPANQAPAVDAGAGQTIMLPASAGLDGTVTDDGLPDPPAAVTVLWTKVSGAGTVSFADAAAVGTTASFSEAGSYVLRLTADDGELQASDEVTITVYADSDGDGMPDWWEDAHGLDKNDGSDGGADPDGDGLTNQEEYEHATDPLEPDTDGDGIPDGGDADPLRPPGSFHGWAGGCGPGAGALIAIALLLTLVRRRN